MVRSGPRSRGRTATTAASTEHLRGAVRRARSDGAHLVAIARAAGITRHRVTVLLAK